MKSIKDLRESYNLITEKEEHDMNKLTQLVRAGLFDAKKLSALKRAMEKPADKMTAQEKRMMINLLDSLMAEVLSDKQVYRKIKQDVMKEAMSDWETKDYFSKNDPRFGRGFPDQKQMPSVLLLKRKGIRVFPDGQKIGLYYAQAIDKYVSIPFSDINISGHSIHEEAEDEDTPPKKTGRKTLRPGEAGKIKWNIGGPKEKEDDNRPNAIRSRMDTLSRKASQAMTKDVRESFQNKLEVLREDDYPGWQPKKKSISDLAFEKLRKARANQQGWKKGSEAAKTGETITSRKRLPTEKIKDKMVDFYGGTKDAVDRVDRITKTFTGATMGAADIAGSALDTGGHLAKGEYKDAAKEFGKGVVLPLATSAIGGRLASRVMRDAEAATSSKIAKDFDIIKPNSNVKTPENLKDVTPPKVAIPKRKSGVSSAEAQKMKNSMNVDVAKTRQSNIAAASREAKAFRDMYPKAKETKTASSKPTTSTVKPEAPKSSPIPKATAADKSSGARVQFKEPEKSKFKIAEPATSKGELVPVRKKPSISAKEKEPSASVSAGSKVKDKPQTSMPAPAPTISTKPASTTSTVPASTTSTTPASTVSTTNKSDAEKKTDTEKKTSTSQQYQQAQQSKTQTKEKTKTDEPSANKTKTDEPAPRKGFRIPALGMLAIGAAGVKGKPLTPGPAKLSLNVSAPRREGDPSAVASRQSALERKALKAQASMNESIELDGNLFELNSKAAKKVSALYESLNKRNKKKMVEMMKESNESLEKVISFAVRQ